MGLLRQCGTKNCFFFFFLIHPGTPQEGGKKNHKNLPSATISEVRLASNMQKPTALYCHRDWIMLTTSELAGQFWDSFQCYSPSCAGLWINRKFQSNYPVQFVRWIDSTWNRKTSQFSFGSAWEDFYGQ